MFLPNLLSRFNLWAKNNSCERYTSAVVGSFGANVARLRKLAGKKGVELAKDVNVKPPVLSAWENNRGGLPETPTLLKLAKALKCSVDELLEGVDDAYDEVMRRRNHAVHAGGSAQDVLLGDLLMKANARRVMEAITRLPDAKLESVAGTVEWMAELYEAADQHQVDGRRKAPSVEAVPDKAQSGRSRRVAGQRLRS